MTLTTGCFGMAPTIGLKASTMSRIWKRRLPMFMRAVMNGRRKLSAPECVICSHPAEAGCRGNNDSGGLSSCYVWNAIGLFPVSGQPVMLIGSPIFDSVTMRLPRAELTVITENNSDTGNLCPGGVIQRKIIEQSLSDNG